MEFSIGVVIALTKKLKIEKGKKKEKIRVFDCAEELFDTDIMSQPHIEMFGNGKITIEGCMGVFEYESNYLKLKLQKGMLILCGTDFDIVFFENRLMTVKGKILSVEFCM